MKPKLQRKQKLKMLLEQPQDHKYLIFSKLDTRDLVNLSVVCKSLYHDKIRKNLLIQRLVEENFYLDVNEVMQKVKPASPFPSVCTYEEYENFYYKALSKLAFSDMKLSYDQEALYASITRNGLTKCFQVDVNFALFQNETMYDPMTSNKGLYTQSIIENLVRYFYDLWTYAESKGQIVNFAVYDYMQQSGKSKLYFDFYDFYQSILKFLAKIFLSETDIHRKYILDQLLDLKLKTLCGKSYDEPIPIFGDKGMINNNEFMFSLFFEQLTDPMMDIDQIIDIGRFLESYPSDYPMLYYFLRNQFDYFLDLDNTTLDEIKWVRLMYDPLPNAKQPKSYLDRMLELFTSANYNIHNEFMMTVNIRNQRCLRDQMMDEDSENDYDF